MHLRCFSLGLCVGHVFTSPAAQQRGSGAVLACPVSCYAHSPREPKLATCLFLRTPGQNSVQEGPLAPLLPLPSPTLNPPSQMGVMKSETVSPQGIFKGKWMPLCSDDFITLSA